MNFSGISGEKCYQELTQQAAWHTPMKENWMTSNNNTPIGLLPSQSALLLGRLEAMRGELGGVGEELIALLKEAGVSAIDNPCSIIIDPAEQK